MSQSEPALPRIDAPVRPDMSILTIAAYLCYAVLAVVTMAGLSMTVGTPVGSVLHNSDIWHHLASFQAILADPLSPEPVATAPFGQSFTPFSIAIGLIAGFLGESPLQAMIWSGYLNLSICVLGIFLFARSYWRSAWAPSGLLLTLFGSWIAMGPQTGFFSFQTLVFSLNDPGFLCLGLLFLLWWSVLQNLDRERPAAFPLILTGSLMALSLTVDQVFALFGIVMAASMLAFSSRRSPLMIRMAILAAMLVGSAASALWPYFNPVALIAAGPTRIMVQYQPLPDPISGLGDVVALAGLAAFGLIGFVSTRTGKLRWIIALPALLLVIAILAAAGMPQWVREQLVALLIIVLQLGVVSFLFQENSAKRAPVLADLTRGTVVAALAVGFGLGGFFAFETYNTARDVLLGVERTLPPPEHWDGRIEEAMTRAEQFSADGATVIAFGASALPFMTTGLKPLAVPPPQAEISSLSDTELAVGAFFSESSSARMRCNILATHEIGAIVYVWNDLTPEVAQRLLDFGPSEEIDNTTIIIPDSTELCRG